MKKQYFIISLLCLILAVSICMPVFALNGESNYTQKLSGNSYYFSVGNIGNVRPDSDIIVPIYLDSIGKSIPKLSSVSIFVDYNADNSNAFTFVDAYWANQIPQNWSEDDLQALNSLIGSEELLYTSGCSHLMHPTDNGVNGTIICTGYSNDPDDGYSAQAFNARGPIAFIVLHTSDNFSGDHKIKFRVYETTQTMLFYLPIFQVSEHIDYHWNRKEPFSVIDGIISSNNISSTITFVDWNGTVLDTQLVLGGNNPSDIPHPKRIGYEFDSWDKNLNSFDDVIAFGGYNVYRSSIVAATYSPIFYNVDLL